MKRVSLEKFAQETIKKKVSFSTCLVAIHLGMRTIYFLNKNSGRDHRLQQLQ